MQTCGTCKYWKPFEKVDSPVEGFGTCKLAKLIRTRENIDNWLFGLIDGTDYFAALKTKESFGCNQHEDASGVNQTN